MPASRRIPFKGLGTDAAPVTVTTGTVVEGFNVIADARSQGPGIKMGGAMVEDKVSGTQ